MRQLSSWNAISARKDFFRIFVFVLKSHGIEDPFLSFGNRNMSLATDFRTTYAIALWYVLSEIFQSASPMTYVQNVCTGCDVHNKRIILEKLLIREEYRLYRWAVGQEWWLQSWRRKMSLRNLLDFEVSTNRSGGGSKILEWQIFYGLYAIRGNGEQCTTATCSGTRVYANLCMLAWSLSPTISGATDEVYIW